MKTKIYQLACILICLFIQIDAMQESSREQEEEVILTTLVQDLFLQKKEEQSTQSDPLFTEPDPLFNLKNLGKPVPALGILRNKRIGTNEPLFKDFWGGEWVLAPLGTEKRLCAAIFEGFTTIDGEYCHLITGRTLKHSTNFTYEEFSVISLFLLRNHFDSNEQGELLEYVGPSEQDLCSEFTHWLEDNPSPKLDRERKNRFSRTSRRHLNQRPKASRMPIFSYEEEQEDTYTKVTHIPAATSSSSPQKSSSYNTFSWFVSTAGTSIK